MPIYEYKCDACGHVLDALQKIDEEPLKFCPSCSKEALRKLISAPSFRLKGSGWYETDFKKDNKRNLAEGGSGEKKEGDSKGDTSSKESTKEANKSTDSKPKSAAKEAD